MNNLSSEAKTRVKSTKGYDNAKLSLDLHWLTETLDNIMANFEVDSENQDIAMDRQMRRIQGMRQKDDQTIEEFVKAVRREIKVYETHGGRYMWGSTQDDELKAAMVIARAEHKKDNREEKMTSEEEAAERERQKRLISERLVPATIINSLDKR